METRLDELAVAVNAIDPEQLGPVISVAYDVGLELVGQKLAGPSARSPEIEDAWRRILPVIAKLVSAAPAKIIPAVCNAIHQIATTSGTRAIDWISAMAHYGQQGDDVDTVLKLGQVAAWRSGMAHFRIGALAAADDLPEHLALAAVSAAPGVSWASLRERLGASPWFDPAHVDNPPATLRLVGRVGSFRGFGGLFGQPPVVTATEQHILARSDENCWVLTADCFGATFHRIPLEEFQFATQQARLPTDLELGNSQISLNGSSLKVPAAGDITSVAANVSTLALTSRLTHSILLVALN